MAHDVPLRAPPLLLRAARRLEGQASRPVPSQIAFLRGSRPRHGFLWHGAPSGVCTLLPFCLSSLLSRHGGHGAPEARALVAARHLPRSGRWEWATWSCCGASLWALCASACAPPLCRRPVALPPARAAAPWAPPEGPTSLVRRLLAIGKEAMKLDFEWLCLVLEEDESVGVEDYRCCLTEA